MIIALLELVSAALLLVPRTRTLELSLVSAFLSGAIAAHVGHSQPPRASAVLPALIWIATGLKRSLRKYVTPWPTMLRSGYQETANRAGLARGVFSRSDASPTCNPRSASGAPRGSSRVDLDGHLAEKRVHSCVA